MIFVAAAAFVKCPGSLPAAGLPATSGRVRMEGVLRDQLCRFALVRARWTGARYHRKWRPTTTCIATGGTAGLADRRNASQARGYGAYLGLRVAQIPLE